jgi:phospholipid/cholesterol/gamma-HCH transport system substrate-binding protein
MKRRDEVLVGVFTTAAVIIAALGATWLVRGGLASGYPLHSRFAWGSGLKQGAPVWLVGVTVGYVDRVDLDPRGTLVVTYRIREPYRVPRSSVATIVPNGLFGDQAVALTPSVPGTDSFAAGDTVPVGVAGTGVQALMSRADTLSATIGDLLMGARQQMVDSGGLRQARILTANLNALTLSLGEIAALQSREIQSTMATLRGRIASIDSARIDSTVRSLQATTAALASFTEGLGEASGRLNAVLAKVDSGGGSVALLLNDPGLYLDTRRLLARLDSMVLDFKTNPRKYLKFSVF